MRGSPTNPSNQSTNPTPNAATDRLDSRFRPLRLGARIEFPLGVGLLQGRQLALHLVERRDNLPRALPAYT